MGKRRKLGKTVFGWDEKMRHPFWIKVWPGKKLWWFLWEKKMQCSGDDTIFGGEKKEALGGIVRVGQDRDTGVEWPQHLQMNAWTSTAGIGLLVLGKVNSAPWGTQGYELKNGGVLLRLPHFLSYNI